MRKLDIAQLYDLAMAELDDLRERAEFYAKERDEARAEVEQLKHFCDVANKEARTEKDWFQVAHEAYRYATKERDDYKNRIDGTANLLSELRLKYGAMNFETFPDFIKRLCSERNDARAWAIYWRKMYDDKLRQSVDLDCKVYIAEDERSEAVRDLVDAENEIKRLRLMVMERPITDGCKAIPVIGDGFGNTALAWCRGCGGDMQVVRPGKFQCAECEAMMIISKLDKSDVTSAPVLVCQSCDVYLSVINWLPDDNNEPKIGAMVSLNYCPVCGAKWEPEK